MKRFSLVIIAVGLASVANAGDLALTIVPQNLEVGRYTSLCGAVKIENQGIGEIEFGCPTPASGTMGFEVRHDGKVRECIASTPLRSEVKRAILRPGESVFVPFLVMNTDDCEFIFAEKGRYEVTAFVRYAQFEDVKGEFGICTPVAVSVYDWKQQEDWARSMVRCSIPLAFGFELCLEQMEAFAGAKPLEPMIPFLMGSGKTLNALWRGETEKVNELFLRSKMNTMEGSIGLALWDYLRTSRRTLDEMSVIRGGDYVVGF